jgi:hypothetical protein
MGESAQDIINEAERKPEAQSTLTTRARSGPDHPLWCDPITSTGKAVEWAEQAKDPKGKKYRIDGHCIAAGVFSVPRTFQMTAGRSTGKRSSST